MNFGFESGSESLPGLINCHDMVLEHSPGLFSGSCYGDGWGGSIKFEALGEDKRRLELLKVSATKEYKSWKMNYLFYKVVTYPLFIYAFLLVSAILWMILQAIRFVRRG